MFGLLTAFYAIKDFIIIDAIR